MEDCTQVANEADDVQVTQGSSSANKEQWNTKLGSTLAYILGNTDDVHGQKCGTVWLLTMRTIVQFREFKMAAMLRVNTIIIQTQCAD